VAATSKRVMSLEEEFEGTETKLAHTSIKLAEATKAADDSERSIVHHTILKLLNKHRVDIQALYVVGYSG